MKTRHTTILAAILTTACLAGGAIAGPADGKPLPIEPRLERSSSPPGPPAGLHGHGRGATRDDVRIAASDLLAPGGTGSESGRSVTAPTRISNATLAGTVRGFALTPDGQRAIYIADATTAGVTELFSVPVDGSAAPVELSAALTFGSGDEGVSAFGITPDGARVVFLADPTQGSGNDDLYSVPVNGGVAPVRINLGSETPVSAFGIAPNSTQVAYFGQHTTGAVELYRAAIATVGSGFRLTSVGSTNAQGDVVAARFTPDGSRVVFSADSGADDVYQWHSVAMSASTATSAVTLSNALNFVSLGAITPNGTKLVYTADESLSLVMDLFVVSITGGSKLRLNPAHSGNGVNAIRLSADGTRVVYLADQSVIDLPELFSAQLSVAGSGTRLNVPLTGVDPIDTLTVAPDGTTVLYESDENTVGTFDLMSVPIDGGSAPSTLHAMTPPDTAGFFGSLGTPVVGRRVIYPVFGTGIDLYNVPFDGGAQQVINGPMAGGEQLFNVFVPAQAERLMAYGAGPTSSGLTSRLSVATIRGDFPPQQVNLTASTGALGVFDYEVSAGETHAVWIQDQTTSGKPELYSRELDTDADGVGNAGDNCAFVANPLQGAVTFAPVLQAADKSTFVWSGEAEVRWARGSLATVDQLTTDASGVLADASSLTDASIPGAGAGSWHLVAHDCSGRSWQTAIGTEPLRDTAGLP